MTLRYPKEIGGADNPSYVQFTPMQYRSNLRGGPAAGDAESVILYMPNSTPAMGNTQNWGEMAFAGPAGRLKAGAVAAAADVAYSSSVSDIRAKLTESLTNVKNSVGNGKMMDVGRQAALSALARQAGMTAGQALALSQGKVYNPNVELLYTMPGMRAYDFSFSFVPKDEGETRMMNQIIKNFRKWSAPKETDGGMFEVPHVWQIEYMTGGRANENMNKFKPAACQSVTVQANPQMSMHVAHEDGAPIETVMSLSFREVDIITRKDHDDGNQGY